MLYYRCITYTHLLQLYSVESQGNAAIVFQIYWMHVHPVRAPLLLEMLR